MSPVILLSVLLVCIPAAGLAWSVLTADKQGRTALDMALGKGGPGRAGQAPAPRPTTIALLRKLMGVPQ